MLRLTRVDTSPEHHGCWGSGRLQTHNWLALSVFEAFRQLLYVSFALVGHPPHEGSDLVMSLEFTVSRGSLSIGLPLASCGGTTSLLSLSPDVTSVVPACREVVAPTLTNAGRPMEACTMLTRC